MRVRPVEKSDAPRGSVLVIVLVSLLVASMLGVGLIKTVLIHQRQMRVLDGQQQGFWLAEAGLQRAARQLANTPEYEGETWNVSTDVLGSSRSAKVTIEVAKSDDQSNEREIRIGVHLDDGCAQPTGCQREHTLLLRPREPGEQSEE